MTHCTRPPRFLSPLPPACYWQGVCSPRGEAAEGSSLCPLNRQKTEETGVRRQVCPAGAQECSQG